MTQANTFTIIYYITTDISSLGNLSCKDSNRCVKAQEQVVSASLPSLITEPLSLDPLQWLSSLNDFPLHFLYSAFPSPGSGFLTFFTWLPFLTFKTLMLSHLLHGDMMESPFLILKPILWSSNTYTAGNSTSVKCTHSVHLPSVGNWTEMNELLYSHSSEHPR